MFAGLPGAAGPNWVTGGHFDNLINTIGLVRFRALICSVIKGAGEKGTGCSGA